jgi:hypothetical protein
MFPERYRLPSADFSRDSLMLNSIFCKLFWRIPLTSNDKREKDIIIYAPKSNTAFTAPIFVALTIISTLFPQTALYVPYESQKKRDCLSTSV